MDLERMKIASPCGVNWNEMTGNDQVRHCQHCKLNVFNVSEMSREEGEALLRKHAGKRLCVRFHRRADGTVMTRNCPLGQAQEPKRRTPIAAAAGLALGLMTNAEMAKAGGMTSASNNKLSKSEAIEQTINPVKVVVEICEMGEVIAPTEEDDKAKAQPAPPQAQKPTDAKAASSACADNMKIMGKMLVPKSQKPVPTTGQPVLMGIVAPPAPEKTTPKAKSAKPAQPNK